jgi:VCBS repeat-containing protein
MARKPTIISGTKGNNSNLVGSLGRDNINALQGDDNITGLLGDDNINGGTGFDTANFSGSVDTYQFQWINGTLLVAGDDGADKLIGVESLAFRAKAYSTTGPIARTDTKATSEDTPLIFQAADLLSNDTDLSQLGMTVTSVGNALQGVVNLVNGTITFTPDLNFGGTGSFEYTVTSTNGLISTAVVNVTVNTINDAPVGVADSYTLDENTTLTILAIEGVLNNDTDEDGDSLAAVLVSGPQNGDLTLNADGSFSYTPDTGWFGTDSFTYKANDGVDDSAATTVSLTINAGNEGPTPNLIVDFEDVGEDENPLQTGYQGFNWAVTSEFEYGQTLWTMPSYQFDEPNSGFYQSGSGIIAYTPYGSEPLEITRSDGSDFNFDKVELTAGWEPWLVVQVTGYNNDVQIGTQEITVNNQEPTLFDPTWGDIDKLVFDVTANSEEFAGSKHLVLDNLYFTV